ncbi:PREDICTED: probable E3 ubiquitin-protein ligase RNF217 [Amphimedon queenslandica]|uniref:RBR-type E3 ubiquitin transferase n=1 Tax=Amphimedon queenslandica TaxID=400682 RepID=A0A1X7UMC6_AMPQE|nr:PREDICTED: probable E3 ubiquitin-protein ligase RNF217 [Amphimedon queenslandica]|eukprot:XP_011404683.1 PREDICTED: probable E3 ubiquitin-protein ligase RNF217 [Amphimedon queenslandica]
MAAVVYPQTLEVAEAVPDKVLQLDEYNHDHSHDRDSGQWSLDNDDPKDSPGLETVVISRIPTPPPPPPLPQVNTVLLLPGSGLTHEDFITEFQDPIGLDYDSNDVATCDCMQCPICLCKKSHPPKMPCCQFEVCKACVRQIIATNIGEGRSFMPCPNSDCNKALTRDFILQYATDSETKAKYEQFRVNQENDPTKKTCPNCCLITERNDLPEYKLKPPTPEDYNITCDKCSFQWCFSCHSPWHEGISCKAYHQGDQQFHKWTRDRMAGFTPNCQKCPKCKVFIQRSTGCDSMICNQCHTNFCYKCGGKFKSVIFLGDHYQRLAPYGCSYNYLPERPAGRRFIRGGYIFVKAAALTGYPILFVGACTIIIVAGAVILPVVGTVKLCKGIKRYIRRR